MGYLVKHKRIKPKYNPIPTAMERAFHDWLIERFPCICGCRSASTVVHHPLTRHPAQRWRRDHEYVVPMHWICHIQLHECGDEKKWRHDLFLPLLAHEFRRDGIDAGILRKAA